MNSFKEFFYGKPNIQQINSYLKGLSKQLSLKDLINHLKKHFELTKIKMNSAGNKVLAFEETKRDYKKEYKKFQSSPDRIKYRASLVKYNRDKEPMETVMVKTLLIKMEKSLDLKIRV